jgi:hypothetical protein
VVAVHALAHSIEALRRLSTLKINRGKRNILADAPNRSPWAADGVG